MQESEKVERSKRQEEENCCKSDPEFFYVTPFCAYSASNILALVL